MALRSVARFLKVLSTKKNICFTVVFHVTVSQDYFFEIIFLITNKANKAPSISATI